MRGNADQVSDAEMAALLEQLRHPQLHVGDKRTTKRKVCRWGAVLMRSPQNLSCIVEDISIGGCRVRVTGSRITVGEAIVIDIPSQKMVLDGVVVWKRDREAGIQFGFTEQSYNKNE